MFQALAPVTGVLIAVNVIVYALQSLLGDQLSVFALWPLGEPAGRDFLPFHSWQLVTYAFLHSNGMHIFFNMLALYMFGSDVERLLGRQRYLIYYCVCVVGAAAMQLVVNGVLNSPYPVIGASGGVFGLLLAFGMAYPHRRILLLFPPIPMPAWLFVTLYGLIELFLGITQTQQGVAHFAHLGGMAAGFLLLQYWGRKRIPR